MHYLERRITTRKVPLPAFPSTLQQHCNTVVMSSGMYRTLPYLPTFMRGNSSSGHHHNTTRSVCFPPHGMLT